MATNEGPKIKWAYDSPISNFLSWGEVMQSVFRQCRRKLGLSVSQAAAKTAAQPLAVRLAETSIIYAKLADIQHLGRFYKLTPKGTCYSPKINYAQIVDKAQALYLQGALIWLRGQKALSKQQAARRARISLASLNAIEMSIRTAEPVAIGKLCRSYGFDYATLLKKTTWAREKDSESIALYDRFVALAHADALRPSKAGPQKNKNKKRI